MAQFHVRQNVIANHLILKIIEVACTAIEEIKNLVKANIGLYNMWALLFKPVLIRHNSRYLFVPHRYDGIGANR